MGTARKVIVGTAMMLLLGVLVWAGLLYSWGHRLQGVPAVMSWPMSGAMIWMPISALLLIGVGILIGWALFAKK